MKNWLPFVFGPAFAMEMTPASCLRGVAAALILELVTRTASTGVRRIAATCLQRI